jgi:hypothetical protein
MSILAALCVGSISIGQEEKAPLVLRAGTVWIGKAKIPIDDSGKTMKDQAIAMRIEQVVQRQVVHATLWPTDALLLRLKGELSKENHLQLRVIEVCQPKDRPLEGHVWRDGIVFQGRISGEKIEGSIRWPVNAQGVAKQGTFVLRAIK